MSVALLFTGLTRHPKIRRAGESAGWMFVCCLEYAAEFGGDGFIPTDAIDSFGLKNTAGRLKKLLYFDDRLGPLLHAVDGGYEIHDYLEWNRRTAQLNEQARAKSEAKSRAGKAGAAVRWGNGKLIADPDSKPIANGIADAWQSDSPSSSSSSVSSSLVDPPPLRDARATTTGGRSEPVGDSVRRARWRATGDPHPDLDGWDTASVRRAVGNAADRWHTDPDDAYERLLALAAMPETRSPGRLLEPSAWAWAGGEVARIASDAARRRQQDADDRARRAEHDEAQRQTDDRRARVTALADRDPEGWQQAVAAATAALRDRGSASPRPLVESHALAAYDQQGAPT